MASNKLFGMEDCEALVIIPAGMDEPLMVQRLAYVIGPGMIRSPSGVRQHGRKVAERCDCDWVLTLSENSLRVTPTPTKEESLALAAAPFIS